MHLQEWKLVLRIIAAMMDYLLERLWYGVR